MRSVSLLSFSALLLSTGCSQSGLAERLESPELSSQGQGAGDDHGDSIWDPTWVSDAVPLATGVLGEDDIDVFVLWSEAGEVVVDGYSNADVVQLLDDDLNVLDEATAGTFELSMVQEHDYERIYMVFYAAHGADLPYSFTYRLVDYGEEPAQQPYVPAPPAPPVQDTLQIGTDGYLPNYLGAGDVHSYTLEVPAGRRVAVWTEGNTDTYGSAEDAYGQIVADDDSGTGTNFRLELSTPGLHEIRVEGYSASTAGAYTLYTQTL